MLKIETLEQQKGRLGEEPPFASIPTGGTGRDCLAFVQGGLRQVIAERGPNHVVNGLGLNATRAGPGISAEVRVLNAPAEAAVGALVDLVPEAEGPFVDEASIPSAGSSAGRSRRASRDAFGTAAGVVGCDISVATDFIVRSVVGGDGGSGGLETARRAAGSAGAIHCGVGRAGGDVVEQVSGVAGAPSVFTTVIGKDVEFGRGVKLERSQAMGSADQGLSAVGPEGEVGKLSGAIAAYTVAGKTLYSKFQFLVQQRQPRACADTTAGARVIEGANGGWRCVGASSGGSGEGRAIQHHSSAGVGCCRAYYVARIDAIAESAQNPEQFVVAKARIRSGLENHVGGFIDGVAGWIEGVQEAAGIARRNEK